MLRNNRFAPLHPDQHHDDKKKRNQRRPSAAKKKRASSAEVRNRPKHVSLNQKGLAWYWWVLIVLGILVVFYLLFWAGGGPLRRGFAGGHSAGYETSSYPSMEGGGWGSLVSPMSTEGSSAVLKGGRLAGSAVSSLSALSDLSSLSSFSTAS